MKIIIQNHQKNPVFEFDAETGKARVADGASMDAVGLAFLKSLECMASQSSSYNNGQTVRDFLIISGGNQNSGDYEVRTGPMQPGGVKGGNVTVTLGTESEDCSHCDYCKGRGVGIFGMRCQLCNGTGHCTLDNP